MGLVSRPAKNHYSHSAPTIVFSKIHGGESFTVTPLRAKLSSVLNPNSPRRKQSSSSLFGAFAYTCAGDLVSDRDRVFEFEQFKARMSGEDGSLKRHSRDSLVYLTTCMIGHLVQAHLKNGSVYSGIFHAADVDKDFGIVLKMASLVKDGTFRKPPYKTFIIPADELVQVVAKDLSVVSDGKLNAVQSEKSVELLTDSSISKSCRVVQRSERKPRVLDGEAPEGLDNVFDESCKSEEQVLKATPLMVSSQLKVQESTSLVQTVEEKNSPGKESAEAPPSSMSSSQLTYRPEEWKEEGIKSFFKVATGASREAAIACLSNCKWNQDDAISYFFGDYTEAIQDSTSPVKESAEALSSSMSSIVKSFCDVVIVASRKDAEACLSHCKWNQEDAISYFFGEYTEANPEIAWVRVSPFRMKQMQIRAALYMVITLVTFPLNSGPKIFLPKTAVPVRASWVSEETTIIQRVPTTPEKSVSGSGHGDIKEGGGGTSASKTVAENERQVSQVSGETKSESAFGQSDSRRISESGPAPPTSTRPGLSPSSSISSLPSPEKSTLNPNAKFEQFKATMSVEDGSLKRHSRDSLVYLTTCMIGHLVEAHLKNGSIYSGIFHAADVKKDFGIVLKMASLVKDGTLPGHKSRSQFVRKPPYKTFIIPADELLQVVAKDLSVFSDGKLKAVQSEKSVELLTDSSISKSCRVDQGRELKPWVPDGEAPEGLDNVFDKPWKRGGWDQFKVNQERFGVKSTFNEEMYTTPLDRGLRTRELEEKAGEIAREIEGENTGDLHVAEERGLQVNDKFDTDEEAKYSAVRRVDGFDDSGFDEEDEKLLDTCNDQTFGGSSTSIVQKPTSSSGQKPTSSSGKGYGGESCSIADDHAGHLPSEQRSKDFPAQGSMRGSWVSEETTIIQRLPASPEASVSGHGDIEEGANLGGGGTSSASMTVAEKERQVGQVSGERKSEISFGQSASRRGSESGPAPSASTRPGLSSPSSSISSLPSSEKSILNPNAKEFKPSQSPAPVRPQSPIAGGSFYYAAPTPPVQQMPVMPAGYGIQPQYPGQQQLLRYPGHEYPQTYYPPNAPPQYQQWQQLMMQGQELMMQGQQPRPPDMIYMPLPAPYQPGNPHNQG
ncbi:hypothetical protein YC2023_038726 [Brassica napus]